MTDAEQTAAPTDPENDDDALHDCAQQLTKLKMDKRRQFLEILEHHNREVAELCCRHEKQMKHMQQAHAQSREQTAELRDSCEQSERRLRQCQCKYNKLWQLYVVAKRQADQAQAKPSDASFETLDNLRQLYETEKAERELWQRRYENLKTRHTSLQSSFNSSLSLLDNRVTRRHRQLIDSIERAEQRIRDA